MPFNLAKLVDTTYGIPDLDEEEPPGNEEFFNIINNFNNSEKPKKIFSEEIFLLNSEIEIPKYYFNYDPSKKPFEYFSEN
jgi:hypothetical protein